MKKISHFLRHFKMPVLEEAKELSGNKLKNRKCRLIDDLICLEN